MKSEKKIFFEQDDTLKDVLKKISRTSAQKIVINIAKNSILGNSIENFHTIRHAGEEQKKVLIVESVDEHILELASLAQIKAENPVFRTRERSVFDILPKIHTEKIIKTKDKKIRKEREENDEAEEKFEIKITEYTEAEDKQKKKCKKPPHKKRWAVVVIAVLILCGGIWFAITKLPKATIEIMLKKTPISFSEVLEVNSKITTPDIKSTQKIILPGELISAEQNILMEFPAGKKEKVERKSNGTLILYNSFSSSQQVLVALTRFESPDGKIFKLDSRTVVPGAIVKDGKIIPSKIEIKVTADKPGEEYNIQPVSGWRIPGFKGTSKYSGFYAENIQRMQNGFVGEQWMPTDDDKIKAEIEIENVLRDSLEARMFILLSSKEFKILKEATLFTVTKMEIQEIEKEPQKFGIYAEAEAKKLIFSEEMLKDVLIQKQKDGLAAGNIKPIEFNLSYGAPDIDFSEMKMTVKVTGNAIFTENFSADKLAEELRGQDESLLRQTIFSLPGLENASISLWPFWVKSVPENTERIKILIR